MRCCPLLHSFTGMACDGVLLVRHEGGRRAALPRIQGCSTLWNAEEVEEAIEAANGGTEAILGE